MTNTEIEAALAEEAKCDRRRLDAPRARLHDIRGSAVRDRVAFALRRRPELAANYSKEHYP